MQKLLPLLLMFCIVFLVRIVLAFAAYNLFISPIFELNHSLSLLEALGLQLLMPAHLTFKKEN